MSTTPTAAPPPVGAPMPPTSASKSPKWVQVVAIAALPCSLIPFLGLGLSVVGLGAGWFYRRTSTIVMSSIAFVIALLMTIAFVSSSTPTPTPTVVPPGQQAPAPAPEAPAPEAPAPAPEVPAPAPAAPEIPYPAPPLPNAPDVDSPGASAGAYYSNCAAARAAGVAPLHTGDPGYRAGLDRDGDGIACE